MKFHEDYDNNIDKCVQLKHTLEDAIQRRYMKYYIVNLRIGSTNHSGGGGLRREE